MTAKTWKVVKSRDVFDIEVLYGLTPFNEFQEMVARKCNVGFPNTTPIVMKTRICWFASIPKVSVFLKKHKHKLNGTDYKDWLKSAKYAKKSKVFLKLKMDNPAGAIKDTEMEDLLAAPAAHEQAVKEMNGKRKLCGYIDPSDPHQYILITLEACQEWACTFMKRKEGVTSTSPPPLLHHLTLKVRKLLVM
ncbi:hypothetical protein VP01_5913g1 [Puccinia sorghi]|uniref:Uncharacterized protein n=1 Tax=Puccinia sorghi TaxID=27349 RepID=A0A0L6UHR3_9BASI|nr:hypothetical protein VP01_5913g1 [Puccinia sorghi]